MSARQVMRFLLAVGILFPLAAIGQPQPPAWSLVRDVTIGGTDGSDAELGMPQAFTVGPDGHIYVFDYTPRQIKQYDQTGRFVRTIGRRGQGPGEFANVHALGFLGDTLWADDVDLHRITMFGRDMQSPKTFTLFFDPRRPGLLTGTPKAMLTGGLAVAQGTAFIPRSMREPRFASPIVLIRRDGTIVDTAAAPIITGGPKLSVEATGARGRYVYVSQQPFQADPLWRGIPGGRGFVVVEAPIVTTDGPASFTIGTFGADGRSASVKSYPYRPIAVTDRIVDSVVSAGARLGGANAERSVREQLVIPKFLPPVTDLFVGRDGSIWVRREPLVEGGLVWNVIDPVGRMAGRVVMPSGIRVVYADLTQVLGVERNPDGIATIVRLCVTRDQPRDPSPRPTGGCRG